MLMILALLLIVAMLILCDINLKQRSNAQSEHLRSLLESYQRRGVDAHIIENLKAEIKRLEK